MSGAHGHVLRLKIRLAAPLLNAVTSQFWNHARLAQLFPVFLQTIHGSVSATVPLMQTAIDVLDRQEPDSPLSTALRRYFERHIVEEAAHDEWLLQDLEALGLERHRTRHIPPPPVARMVGAQYYWIQHAHPVSLLGFFAVLEGHPPTCEDLDDVQQRTHLPSVAFRMLRHHAVEDPSHADELFHLVDSLPLEPWHVDLIGMSALDTLAAVRDVFLWLLSRAEHLPPRTAEPVAP
jgi:hypothetical protein